MNRRVMSVTIAPDVWDAVQVVALREDAPMSRVVERSLRASLGMPELAIEAARAGPSRRDLGHEAMLESWPWAYPVRARRVLDTLNGAGTGAGAERDEAWRAAMRDFMPPHDPDRRPSKRPEVGLSRMLLEIRDRRCGRYVLRAERVSGLWVFTRERAAEVSDG